MKRITIVTILLAMTSICTSAQEERGGRTLTLQECIDMASGGNVNVRNSHLDILSARMQKREALAEYFPSVNASAVGFGSINPLVRIGMNDLLGSSDLANNLKYYLGTAASLNGIPTTYETLSNACTAGLVLSQPVFAGGRIVNGNRLAALGVEAASLKENIALRDVASEIESKYWTAVSLEEKMALVDGAIALTDSLLKDTQSYYRAGLLTDSGSDMVMLKKQELKAQRVRLKGGIMLARMDLCEAVGLSSSEAMTLTLADTIPVLGDPGRYWKDPSEIVSGMDESRLLDMAVRQKQLEKNMALGEALPQVGVGASYGYGKVIGDAQRNGMVFAMVKIPLTDWSKAASRMKRLDYQMEKARNERDHYAAMLELRVRQLWVEVEACWEELSIKVENESIAEKAFMRAEADLAAGLATVSEMMEKQVTLSDAKCAVVDARISYRKAVSAYFSLYLSNGRTDK